MLDNLSFIICGVLCLAVVILFFVFIYRFDGVNYIKKAYMKDRFRGRIDDIINPKEGDEIKDIKR
jgi:hypothetical protein